MMRRDEALKILAGHYPDGIAVGVYQTVFDWMQIRPHPLNYLCTGAMGQAASHGLGLALGAPSEKVVVLDGDGSLLMNLGCLFTIAHAAPTNFFHFVSHNRSYEVNGNFPVFGGKQLRFDEVAKSAGYSHTFSFSELGDFESEIAKILTLEGPVFVNLILEPGEAYPRDYETIHSSQSRSIFREALQAKLSGK